MFASARNLKAKTKTQPRGDRVLLISLFCTRHEIQAARGS